MVDVVFCCDGGVAAVVAVAAVDVAVLVAAVCWGDYVAVAVVVVVACGA